MLTDLVTIALAIVSAVLVVFVSRRILGAHVGRPRSFVVGLLVFLAAFPFARWVLERVFPQGTSERGVEAALVATALVLLALAWVFALGVAVLVGLEILLPTRPLASPLTVARAALQRRRRSRRYFRLLSVASRHGAGWLFRGSSRSHEQIATREQRADALVATINDAGVTFVKLGQVLSTRRDLVPEPYIGALATLQNHADEVPWPEIRSVLESELGTSVDAAFAEIEHRPLAAASLAQVHSARLNDGRAVVVKVQRPGAEGQVVADADIVRRMASRAEQRSRLAKDLGVAEMARAFTGTLLEELDYRIEARNAEMVRATVAEIAQADPDAASLYVPATHPELSTRRVLTMDLVDGAPVGVAASRLDGMSTADRDELASGLMVAVLSQILVHGVFHADLHPGNVVLRSDGSLGLIDFGAVGIVERSQRELMTALLLSALAEDDSLACDTLLLIVDPPRALDLNGFRHDIGVVLTTARYTGSAGGSIFTRILDVIREHRIALPGNLAAAFRSFATLEGCLRVISPGYDMVTHALPRIPDLVRRTISVRQGAVGTEARAIVTAIQLQRAPRRIDAVLTAVESGTLGAGSANARANRSAQREIVADIVSAAVSIAAAAIATVLVVADGGPALPGDVRAFDLIGAAVGLAGFLGILRVVRRLSARAVGTDR
jgi:ubiquinone biosynthesis protein